MNEPGPGFRRDDGVLCLNENQLISQTSLWPEFLKVIKHEVVPALGCTEPIALLGGDFRKMSMAICSMIGDLAGMICDGASNSCAMKVSTSASSAYKAVLMALDNARVTGNEGIVADDVDQSVANLCALANGSMVHTDRQIIEIIMSKRC